ncbi:MAG: phosphoenolpyruvate carboxykinase (GTP), partial [Actinomycetales bacterium]|nr:phosphoenolpyruvate carboxykinase (GTP) [Actinomycetales bacterium]
RVEGDKTAAGITARAADIDMTGLDTPLEDVEAALAVDPEEWRRELPLITEWLEFCGPKVPAEVHAEFAALKERLG